MGITIEKLIKICGKEADVMAGEARNLTENNVRVKIDNVRKGVQHPQRRDGRPQRREP